MRKRILTTIVPVVLMAVAGCAGTPAANPAPAAQAPQAAGVPAGSPSPAPGGGPGAAAQSVSGTVMETMNASNYTYVRVKSDSGEIWAATDQFAVAVGDRVVVPLEMPMENFRSQALKRDFPLIYFASRIAREGEPAMPPVAMMAAHGPAPSSQAAGQGAAQQPPARVEPAPGGMTVADVWAKRKTLGGKTVTVRGKVVRFNAGILGVNWIHLQDGTGTAGDGTNDITITSNDAPKVGDVVTVTGKVALEKDLGSGYSYAVLLEGAKVVLK